MTIGMGEKASLVRAAASLRVEIASVDRVIAELERVLRRHTEDQPEIVVVHGTGGLLHDYYTGIEKSSSTVSPGLNGQLGQSESWHRDLLHTATLDLPGIRPPILSESSADSLKAFLSFRHLYRNLYAFNLRWSRVRELAAGAIVQWPSIRSDLEAFARFLDSAAGVLDEA